VFPLKALGWSLGLFALLRTPWVEEHFVLPLTRFQQGAAEFYAGLPTAPISVTIDCSGTDVLALCLASILAWPASWRARVAGAFGGVALILALNTARIATLGRAASSPALFNTLHLQVWPAILVLATAGYVFLWMRTATTTTAASDAGGSGETRLSSAFSRRFIALAALCLLTFALSGPWIARSETLLAASAWIAGEAALLLGVSGVAAAAAGPLLTTSRGAFLVTPQCLATALVPVYLAFVFAAPLTWTRRFLALLAAAPFFAALAIARVLLLALPPFITSSPLFLVHGFHQLVLALMVVAFIVWPSEPAGYKQWFRAATRAGIAIAAATTFALLAGSALTSALVGLAGAVLPTAPHALSDLSGPGDAQGALATLFAFQASFLLALGISMAAEWRPVLKALFVLFIAQLFFLVSLVEFSDRTGGTLHALLLRATAVGLPLLIAFALLRPRVENSALILGAHGSA
jgi:exosortase/archaeosortase family protein